MNADVFFGMRHRRYLPPPKTNFEKLQDIFMERREMVLDVSSSGALAASLDQCMVRPSDSNPFLVYPCTQPPFFRIHVDRIRRNQR